MTIDFESLDAPMSFLDRLIIGTAIGILVLFFIEFILATPGTTLLRMSFEFFSGYFAWTIWENRHSLRKRRLEHV
jgi:hypothetical protein